jgi:cytochrome c biogenesis protein CcmG/thiol:disulfide interchange protein DsbE
MRKFIPILLITIFLAHPAAWAASPKAGDSAPDFSLNAITGGKHTLSDLKGKVVLVGMFHICVPCMNQAMEFEKVRKALSTDKLVILGIIDSKGILRARSPSVGADQLVPYLKKLL